MTLILGFIVAFAIGAFCRLAVCFDLADFYHNEWHLLGVDSLKRDLTASASILRELAEGFETGVFHPHPEVKSFFLEEVQEAYEHVRGGGRAVFLMKAEK